jgi:hypothetical protein
VRAKHVAGVGLLVIAAGVPSTTAAQRPRWFQRELRGDAIAARTFTSHIAGALSTPLGTYVRGSLALGGGSTWHDRASSFSARLDATGRFMLDPFRQHRWAPYGLAGASVRYDEFDDWQPMLMIGVGVEGPAKRGIVPAFELGLGGGVRIGIALRQAIVERR